MHRCEPCSYSTESSHNLKIHYKSYKHLTNIKEVHELKQEIPNDINSIYKDNNFIDFYNNYLICSNCHKEYKYRTVFNRHIKSCISKPFNESKSTDDEIARIRKEYEYQLEIQKLKFELSKKEIEMKTLQITNSGNNNNNNNNNTVINNNNVKISKVQFLNLNFGNVIDINTFIDNYKDKFGLTNDQTKTLLDNYHDGGVNSCINSLVYYLKKSAIQQYKELKGADLEMDNVILPFVLSDKCLRDHFEKSINGNWDKTTMMGNIKKILSITNDQVFKHHNEHMLFNDNQKKRLINGILKASAYSLLAQITIPDFYKIKSLEDIEAEEDDEEEDDEEDDDESLKNNHHNIADVDYHSFGEVLDYNTDE